MVSFDTYGGHPGIEVFEKVSKTNPSKTLRFRIDVTNEDSAASLAKELGNQLLALGRGLEKGK